MGEERTARKEAAAIVEWGPQGGGNRWEGTHRTVDPEPQGVGKASWSSRQAENRSYLGKICAREQGQCVRRLVSGMKRGSAGLGVAWPRAKVQETEASTRFS